MLKSKLIIKIDASKWLSVLDFLKGYKPPGYKNSGLQWRRIKSALAKSRRVFKTPDLLVNRWGIQSRFGAMAIILSMDMIYSTMETNSPESLQAYDPALGGYII